MSKLLAPVSGIACLIWVSFWSWFLSDRFSNLQSSVSTAPVSVSLRDGDANFPPLSAFSFDQSEATLFSSPSDSAAWNALSVHLKNSGKQLLITGWYSESERNKTPYPNLGLARAEAVKNSMVTAGAPAGQIFTDGAVSQKMLLAGNRMFDAVHFEFTSEVEETTPVIEEKPAVVREEAEKEEKPAVKKPTRPAADYVVRFKAERYKFDDILGKDLPVLETVLQKLEENPNQKVLLYGYRSESEERTTVNLPEARAKIIRRYLIDNGIRRGRIEQFFEKTPAPNGQGKVEIVIK